MEIIVSLPNSYKNQSVSVGTLNDYDLFVAFRDFCINHGILPKNGESYLLETFSEIDPQIVLCGSSEELEEKLPPTMENNQKLLWVVYEFYDLIDKVAPAGCYFGSHPGDGSDIGFWEFETDV